MAKLGELCDVRIEKLVKELISEEVSKKWLKEILLQKKFKVSNFGRDWELDSFFDICIWDNLTEEQKNRVVESLNLIIEEDLFLEKQPEHGYWSDLLDFAILLDKKLPGKINSEPFKIWKQKDYPNIIYSSEKYHPSFIQRLDQKIESAFGKTMSQ